jgi:hypothetical protein
LRFSWRGRDEEKQHYTTHKASYKHKRGLRQSTNSYKVEGRRLRKNPKRVNPKVKP